MKDLVEQLHATRRTVGSSTLPAGPARTMTLSRTYDADVADVWQTLTDPDRVPRWFLPVDGDLRVGGTYRLEGNAGGQIRACEPDRHLQVTWVVGEPPGPEDSSVVDVRLAPLPDGGTRLDLEHVAVVPDEMWDEYGPGAVGVGWDLALVGLGAFLAGVDLGDVAELAQHPELRRFLVLSSEEWGAALAASGADAESVTRRVAATSAIYVPPIED